MKDDDLKKLLTPSQLKLFKDQEQWMKDTGEEYSKERTRLDAIYDLKARFPTEQIARNTIEEFGGDPIVISLYKRGLNKYRSHNKKVVKSVRKCKCK